MTRFIMSLDEAVDLVLFAFENGQNGDLLIMKARPAQFRPRQRPYANSLAARKKKSK